MLNVYSGECRFCEVGIPVNETDMSGKEIHTGDIVQLYQGSYVGTHLEEWMPTSGLTVVVIRAYQSFSDGTHQLHVGPHKPFTMGIASVGVQGQGDASEWKVSIVKKYYDVVDGEHWKEFGFNYREEE